MHATLSATLAVGTSSEGRGVLAHSRGVSSTRCLLALIHLASAVASFGIHLGVFASSTTDVNLVGASSSIELVVRRSLALGRSLEGAVHHLGLAVVLLIVVVGRFGVRPLLVGGGAALADVGG